MMLKSFHFRFQHFIKAVFNVNKLLKFFRLGDSFDILSDDGVACDKIYSPINRLTILRTAAKYGLRICEGR